MHKVQSLVYGDEAENLLDLVVPATTADTNIHTFSEFKEWINTGFQMKTQLNSASYIKKNQMVRSLKLRQAKSFGGSEYTRQGKMIGSLKHRPSISFQTLDQIEEGRQNLQHSNMASSRRSRKASHGGGQLGFQLRQNSFKSKSAQSSRSFNGYDQINQYEMSQLLGKGSFADVYLGVDTESQGKEKYAIKVLESKQIKKRLLLKKNSQVLDSPPPSLGETQHKPKQQESLASVFVRNEVAILKKMSHQYITKLHDVIIDSEKGRVYLVLQYCGGGFINENKDHKGQYRKLLESECKRYCKQLAQALEYIHNVAKIAHRDIKPENILLNEFDEVKVSDFGLGTHKLKGKKASGTPLYMPPQSQNVEGDTANQPGDIWALGVTLLVMLTGKHPDFSEHRIDVCKALAMLKDVSQNCKNFINRCLDVDPTKRIKSEELLGHDWLGAEQLRVTNPLTLTTTNYGISVTPADEENVFKVKQIIRPKKDLEAFKFQFK